MSQLVPFLYRHFLSLVWRRQASVAACSSVPFPCRGRQCLSRWQFAVYLFPFLDCCRNFLCCSNWVCELLFRFPSILCKPYYFRSMIIHYLVQNFVIIRSWWTNRARPLWFESQNQSFIQTEQPPYGSISGTTAGVAESVLLDNKNLRINAIFCSL